MAKLTENIRGGKAPIGVHGVQDYVDKMNRDYPNAPYVWRVGERWHEFEQRMVKCVDVLLRSQLRNSGPRVQPSDIAAVKARAIGQYRSQRDAEG